MPPRNPARPSAARLACAGVGLLLAAAPAWADPAPSLDELLRQAATAPRLVESGAAVQAAEARARQAGVRPNPTLSLEVENFAGSEPFDGLSGSETTLAVSQPLDIGGRRAARAGVARAETDVARARQREAAAGYAYDLTVAYADAEAAERRLVFARDALALAQEDARVARELVDAGREPELRAIQAGAAVSAARAEVEAAGAERSGTLALLTALAGAPAPFTSIAASVLDRPPGRGGLETAASATVLAAEAEREAAARRVRVEALANRFDPTVSIGVRRLQGDEATALVAGISAPLPVFDRNRGATAAAQAELRAAEARLRVARLQAEADGASAAAQVSAAGTRVEAAVQGEAAAARAANLTRIGFEAGRLSLAEVLTARRTLAEARTRTLEARLARVRAEAALARLQGRAPSGETLP